MVQFPAVTREYSLLQNIQTGFGVPSVSYSMGTKCSFPGGKVATGWSSLLTSF